MRSEFSSRGLVVCAMNVNLNVDASGPNDAVEVLFHDFPHDDADFLMFVGVDGGGTGTECLVEVVGGTESDDIVFTTVRSRTGPANANSVGFDQAFANVSNAVFRAVDRAIAECLDRTSPSDATVLFHRGTISTSGAGSRTRKGTAGRARRLRLAGVTLGIAGCDSPADKKVWRDELLLSPGDVPRDCAFAPETLVVENDAVVALARATNGAAGEAPCSSRAQARSRSRYRTRGNARERWDSVRRSVIRARAITSERKRSPRRRGLWTDVARSEGKRQTSTTPTTRKTRDGKVRASRAPC